MASITLENVKKGYGKKAYVIEDLNLKIEDGSFTVLVGPSGCGKSTTLRMIAGLEEASGGELYIGDDNVTEVDAGKRGVSMVFQNYALYPHMTVKENIEFGLKNNKVKKEERERLIEEVSNMVGLEEFLDRKPSDLSGGQRQRVALSRAMVKTPKVFLMDEPLSNLDAKLRSQMRCELIQLHNNLKSTFVYVTHDQVEAMSMADKIVIMNKGKIMQVDSPKDIYYNPKNEFVAQFIGSPAMNILEIEGTDFRYGFRPEKVNMEKKINSSDIRLRGCVLTKESLGPEVVYCIETESKNVMVKTDLDNKQIGQIVDLYVEKSNLYYFDNDGSRIYSELEISKLLKFIENSEVANEKTV